MKKSILLLLFILLAAGNLFSQVNEFSWAGNYSGSANDYIYGMDVDDQGYVYVTGKFKSKPLDFGNGVSISADGLYDIYVAKLSSTGDGVWARKAGGQIASEARAVAVDDGGNVLITGGMYGVATFDNIVKTAVDNFDTFIAKYDADGTIQWVLQGAGRHQIKGTGLIVDHDGNYINTGYFGGSSADTMNYGGISVTGHGNRDIYVAKVQPDGTPLWVVPFGSPMSGEEGKALAVDEDNNIYVTGYFEDTAEFGPFELTSEGAADIFTAKLDPDGNVEWVKGMFGPGDDNTYAMSYSSGTLYVGGYMADTVYVEGTEYISNGGDDLLMAVYETDGTLIGSGIIGGPGDDHIWGVESRYDGTYWITGYFEETVDFMGESITSAGGQDVFVAEFKNDTFKWVKTAGGSDDEDSYGVKLYGEENIFVGGNLQSNDGVFGSFNLASTGDRDPWVGRIGVYPVPVELVSFSARVIGREVVLDWKTATEMNNAGFEIERKVNDGEYRIVGAIEGYGSTAEEHSYTFRDKVGYEGQAYYRLKQIDYDGTYEYFDAVEVNVGKVFEFALKQNYPNPFNPETKIEFELPEEANVTLEVFNMLGERIAVLENGKLAAGLHKTVFGGNDLPSGIYICSLRAETTGKTYEAKNKMILLR